MDRIGLGWARDHGHGLRHTTWLKAGLGVTGFDIDPARREALQQAGGVPAESAAAVAGGSDVVLSALPSVAALHEVVEGENGLVEGAHNDLIVAEMSTFPLEAKVRAQQALRASDATMLDAPVSGTGLQAETAEIVIYASGDTVALDHVRPVLDAIARATFDLGSFGNGSKMKFVANLLVSVHNLATAEAFVLGMKGGLDPSQILDVISAGVGSSRIFESRGPMMVDDDYPPAAKLKMFIKDIDVIGDFGRDLGVPTPLLDASLPWYEEAVEQDLGEFDAAALSRLLEAKAGLVR